MATTIFPFGTLAFTPAPNDELVAGDVSASIGRFDGRPGWEFDDTEEEAIISEEQTVPQGVSGTLSAIIHFFMLSDNTNDIALDVFVESKTPNTDTLDMETTSSWDSANSGTKSLAGSTAGDPLTLSITLSNADSYAAGDLIRFGIRRDCDSANDDASGDLVILGVEIREA